VRAALPYRSSSSHPGFPRWIRPARSKAAEMLAKLPIPSDSFFHPSRPSGLSYLIQRKSLIQQLKLARETGRMPFHPGNSG
jgi:hypothetical protein